MNDHPPWTLSRGQQTIWVGKCDSGKANQSQKQGKGGKGKERKKEEHSDLSHQTPPPSLPSLINTSINPYKMFSSYSTCVRVSEYIH